MHAANGGVHYTDDGHLLVSHKHKSDQAEVDGELGGTDQVDQGISQR